MTVKPVGPTLALFARIDREVTLAYLRRCEVVRRELERRRYVPSRRRRATREGA